MQQLVESKCSGGPNDDGDQGSSGGAAVSNGARLSSSSTQSWGNDDTGSRSQGCLRRGISDSEPGTPTTATKNPDRPMHRNLSDLGPRVKKRVTYRSAHAAVLDDRDRPPSLSDMNAPPTPILKRTLHHAQHIPVEPDIKESPTSFGGSVDSSDIFSSTSPLLPKRVLRHGRSLTQQDSQYMECTPLTTSTLRQHITDHNSSYFDTTIDVQTDDSDSLRNSYGARRTSPPNSEGIITQVSNRRNTTSSYNSSGSELLSDMEEGVLATDDKSNDINSSQNSVFDSVETEPILPAALPSCASSHPAVNHTVEAVNHGTEAVQNLMQPPENVVTDSQATELDTFRRKPESKAFLMRPEVLKLKKTSC